MFVYLLLCLFNSQPAEAGTSWIERTTNKTTHKRVVFCFACFFAVSVLQTLEWSLGFVFVLLVCLIVCLFVCLFLCFFVSLFLGLCVALFAGLVRHLQLNCNVSFGGMRRIKLAV